MIPLLSEDVFRLVLAVLVGGLLGVEREFRDKAAGFRTMILICLGAALFTIFSLKIGGAEDPVRIAANIVSGVGFLGAGAILRDGNRISGLTTASTVWLSAALGMGIGAGHVYLVLIGLGLVTLVMWVFPRIEESIDRIRDTRLYEVRARHGRQQYEELNRLFEGSGMRIVNRKRIKVGQDMVCSWVVSGSPRQHEQLFETLVGRDDVVELRAG